MVTNKIGNLPAIGESSRGKLKEGFAIRREVRNGDRVDVVVISDVVKGIAEDEQGSEFLLWPWLASVWGEGANCQNGQKYT